MSALLQNATSEMCVGGGHYVDNAAFHDSQQRQQILESLVAEEERSLGAAQGRGEKVLSAEEERNLFLQMNCLRYLSAVRRRQAEGKGGHCCSHRRAARCLEASAREVRDRIAACNLRLVRSIASKMAYGHDDRDELTAEGNVALIRVIDHFDVSFGFRFSTYATRALAREMARSVRRRLRQQQHLVSAPDLDPASPPEEERPFDEEQIRLVREILNLLPERDRAILRRRYGFDGEAKILSYRKLAKEFSVSPERVRQLVERSFGLARSRFGSHFGLRP